MSSQEVIRKRNTDWQFPDFTELTFFKKKSKYCVCVFVINEGERIRAQLKKMRPLSSSIDVVVADGGSTDGSLEEGFLKIQNVRTLITKRGPGKLSAQMRMAFAWALDEGYEGIVVVDGNNKDSVEDVPNFIKLLDEGCDHVQGSRFIPGGKAVNTPLSRELGLHLLHAPLISLAAGRRHTDTTNGFRAYSARLLRDKEIAVFRSVFQTYELHYYLAIEASRRKQYKVKETPVVRIYPKGEKIPTKISPLRGNMHILKVLFNAVIGSYKVNSIAPWSAFLWLLTLTLAVLSSILFYPGFASNDTVSQWNQVVGITPVGDWHPPIMVYLWGALYAMTHKMGALLVVQQLVFWLATGLLSIYIYRLTRRKWLSLLPFAVALSPLVIALTGVLWKDVQLAIALFAAVIILIYARQSGRFTIIMKILSMALVAYASLTRYNALAAAIPIMFLWVKTAWPSLSIRRTIAITVLIPVTILALGVLISGLGHVTKDNPTTAVMLDDIIGVGSSVNYEYAPTQIRERIIAAQNKCKSMNVPMNAYWFCINASDRQLFSRDMHKDFVRTWLRVVTNSPLEYFWYRAYTYTVFLFGFNESQYIYVPSKIVESAPGTYTAEVSTGYSTKMLNVYTFDFSQRSFSFLFRPWLWLLLSASIMGFYIKDRQRELVVLVLVTSSIIYILSYIPVAVATDYRYVYWSVIATLLAWGVLIVSKYTQKEEVSSQNSTKT